MKTARNPRTERSEHPTLKVYYGPRKRVPAMVPKPRPAVSEWTVDGHGMNVVVWTYAQLMAMPVDSLPDNAQVLPGIGWVELQPA